MQTWHFMRSSVVGFSMLLTSLVSAQDLGTSDAKTFETLTFSLDNPAFSGNPYDLDATVLFTHSETGEQIRTGMFYDGGSTWRFRFTGTREGTWTFTSQSVDDDLSGASGSINVAFDPTALGFLTTHDTKYGRQIGTAETITAQPYLVYMNRRSEDSAVNPGFGGDTDIVGTWRGRINAERRAAYIMQAQANGANAIFLHVNNQWFRRGALGWDDHNSTDPDRSVFAAIEDLIVDAHSAGVQVHIWAWGDNASNRRWTPTGVAGGINGSADRRVQRYIADRLGPLPGWSMGYGFDLFEWANQTQVSEWANFLTDRMGWDHILSARGLPLLGSDGTEESAPHTFVDGYASLRRSGQILQTDSNTVSRADDGGPDSYAEAREDVLNDPARRSSMKSAMPFNAIGKAAARLGQPRVWMVLESCSGGGPWRVVRGVGSASTTTVRRPAATDRIRTLSNCGRTLRFGRIGSSWTWWWTMN